MKHSVVKILLIIIAVILVLDVGLAALIYLGGRRDALSAPPTAPTAPAPQTEAPEPAQTAAAPTTEATEAPETQPTTEPTTVPTTQPLPERFVLTFAGDCTLGSDPQHYGVKYSLIHTVGEDYDYPFRNVAEYFKNDDFTIVNLEGVLTESTSGRNSSALFTFRGPTAYTQILTGSSVEAVTLANNHTMDYGKQGYESTKEALTEAEVTYVEKNGTALYTTESGLTIGLYAAAFSLDTAGMRQAVANLRTQGAEIVIAAVHWGNEGQYRPTNEQKQRAYAMIDAGVDIVYGSHPHVLQPIEEYGDGIIYYSMGNFCFGGNNYPRDLDSVVLQQEVIREPDGTVRLGELIRIPCSVSSLPVQNNFQPTPYEEGSDPYQRVLDKLSGAWTGADLTVNYGSP